MAAQSGHTEVVSTLLDRGVDINTADKVDMHTTIQSNANHIIEQISYFYLT